MQKKLVLYGSGEVGKSWVERLGEQEVWAFADSDKNRVGKYIANKPIISIETLRSMKETIEIFISTSYLHKKDIYESLLDAGMRENIVGLPYLQSEIYADWDVDIDVESTFEGRNTLAKGVRLTGCKLGYASYIAAYTVLHNTTIGRYSSIGPRVRIICGQHPTKKFVSTHPIFYSTQQIIHKTYVEENLFDEYRYTPNGYTVEIGNDVWIGDGVTIMEGVTIADGTIVASGANLVETTKPYSIVGGNPARIIKYRFKEKDINFLMELQWWNKKESWIDKHAKYFVDIEKLEDSLSGNTEE